MLKKLILSLVLALWSMAAFAVNINTATVEQIAESLDGVGPAKAAAIVAYRDKQGPYKTLKDLLQVKGIGEATLEKNKDKVEF